jgi:hypothetical protein
MYVYFDQLIAELQERHNVRTFNISSKVITGLEIFPKEFDHEDIRLPDGVAHICEYRKLKAVHPHVALPPLICVLSLKEAEMIDGVFFRNRMAAVVIDSSVADVLLTLTNLFYEFGSRCPSLSDESSAFSRCNGMDELIDVGQRIFGNPIVVTGSDQRIIAYTQEDYVTNPLYHEIIKLGHLPVGHPAVGITPAIEFPCDMVKSGYAVAFGRSMNMKGNADGFETGDEKIGLPTVICKPLIIFEGLKGYLHIMEFGRRLCDQDLATAELFGNYLAIEMHRRPKSLIGERDDAKDAFLRDILNDTPWSLEYSEKRRRQVGFALRDSLYVIIAQVRTKDLVPLIPLHSLAKRMARMLPCCHGMLYRNSILLMLGADGMIENMDETLAPIIPVLDEYRFVAGVSNMFRSIHEIRKYAVQSVEALRLGMALHRDRTVYCYRDYAIYYMIEVCLKNESIDMFCLPEVMQFIERGQEYGADIVDTLRSYLRCGRNKTQVSKDMYVHLSTIKYRMAQIQNILGISLDSDENALKIMLSMKMLEYRDAFPNDEFPPLIRPPRSTLHENIKSE